MNVFLYFAFVFILAVGIPMLAISMPAYGRTWGILFQRGGLWVGGHYSTYNKRWCINIIPCCTIWFCKEGGTPPNRAIIHAYTTGV